MTWRKWLTAAAAAATALIAVVAAVQSASLEDRGRELFFADGCYGCHTIGKIGTPIGPDLSHIGTKYSRAYLERWLRDPAAQRPAAHMPNLELTPEEVKALAAFLATRS